MKTHWQSLLLGVAIGAIGLYVLERHGNLGVFIDKINPNQPLIISGGGHSIGG